MPTLLSIALIANPDSGSGDADRIPELLRGEGAEVELFEPGDAGRAARSGAARIVVAGGDGSIAPAAAAAGAAGKPLAVIAVGTANDFARSAGISDDPEEAARLAVRGTELRPHELARLGDRPFVNVASAGLPPVAAREASGFKKALGPLAYAVGAARAGATADPLDCAVICDGEEVHSGGAWQVTVACSGAFGGGSSVEADPQDGALDVVVIPAGSRAALAWRAFGLRSGRIDRQRKVDSHRCPTVRIEAPADTELNVDGEVTELGAGEFSVERDAFELVVA